MIEARPFVSHELGLLPYPVGTIESTPPSGHIMAATALAWLCDVPVDRWGEPWVQRGTIDLRFRSHLSAGLDVELIGDHDDDRIELAVHAAGAPQQPFVTGTCLAGRSGGSGAGHTLDGSRAPPTRPPG